MRSKVSTKGNRRMETYGVVLKGCENNNLFCSLELKNKSRELKRAVKR